MSLEASLVTSARLLQIVHYSNVASCALWIYDYLVTLDVEVDLIWKAKRGSGKTLFLLARYPTVVDLVAVVYYSCASNISSKTCNQLSIIVFGSTLLGAGVAEVILVLRTCALWHNNRKVVGVLSSLYIGATIVAVLICVLFMQSLRFGDPPWSNNVGCFAVYANGVIIGNIALLLIVETTLLVFMLWVGFKHDLLRSPGRLVQVLYTDGIGYYICVFLLTLGNLVMVLKGPREFADLFNAWQRVVQSIISTRILLHVRGAMDYQTVDTGVLELGGRSYLVEH